MNWHIFDFRLRYECDNKVHILFITWSFRVLRCQWFDFVCWFYFNAMTIRILADERRERKRWIYIEYMYTMIQYGFSIFGLFRIFPFFFLSNLVHSTTFVIFCLIYSYANMTHNKHWRIKIIEIRNSFETIFTIILFSTWEFNHLFTMYKNEFRCGRMMKNKSELFETEKSKWIPIFERKMIKQQQLQ